MTTNKKPVKKYRVNESEHFNLMSMYDHIKCEEIDAIDNGEFDKLEDIEKRLDEINELLNAAPCIGSLVTWPQLKRIREIRDERNMIRYSKALASGTPENEAKNAFM